MRNILIFLLIFLPLNARAQSTGDVVSAVIEIAGYLYTDNSNNREILRKIGYDDPTEILLDTRLSNSVGGIPLLKGGIGRFYMTNKRVIFSGSQSFAILGVDDVNLDYREISGAELCRWGFNQCLAVITKDDTRHKFILTDCFFCFSISENEYAKIINTINELSK